MKLAVRLNTDGTSEVIDISGNQLKALQNAVDGYVECITLAHNLLLWVNEEGKIHDLDFNLLASVIFEQALGRVELIVGNVVITGGADDNGDIEGLTDRVVNRIQEWIKVDSQKLARR